MAFLRFVPILATFAVSLLFFVRTSQADRITCKDNDGNPVDWFITYKLPKIHGSSNPNYAAGTGYSYLTPQALTWTESGTNITNPDSIVGRTLSRLYATNDSGRAYVLYNDQPPDQATVYSGGHTKGVLLTGSGGGIWLVHSVPHFPLLDPSSAYSYPGTGFHNGQLFLCLSLNLSQVDGIAEVLKYTRPNFYSSNLPSPLTELLPRLAKVVGGAWQKVPPWYKLTSIQAGELSFKLFAKGPKFQKEIYGDWIGPELGSSLDVQSWLNGPNPFPSNCTTTWQVHNILMKDLEAQRFSTHSDHSKWAVGTEEAGPWTCIGDLNRMEHQTVRGGAVLCTRHAKIWDAFRKAVTETQPCPRVPSPSQTNNV